jgi:hypothetical protein
MEGFASRWLRQSGGRDKNSTTVDDQRDLTYDLSTVRISDVALLRDAARDHSGITSFPVRFRYDTNLPNLNSPNHLPAGGILLQRRLEPRSYNVHL